jgi:hypothetical protein
MRAGTTPALDPKLLGACRAFETWRRTHPARARIPAPLWALAAEVARDYGVNATARRLHLDYYSLKRHVEAAEGARAREAKPAPPAFVEVVAASGPPVGLSECIIDVADGRGTTLRIAVKSPELPDLAALTQTVWRAPA